LDVAVITDEISQDLSEAIAVMRRCEVDQAEIRAVGGVNVTDMDDAGVEEVASLLRREKIQVCGLASPFYKCDLFEDQRAERGMTHQARERSLGEQMDFLMRCFDIAEKLGTNRIRVFSFWRKGDLTPEIEDRIVEMFAEPVQRATERGMELLLENEHACFLGTGEETARVLKRLDGAGIAAVWDPGNALCAGENPFPDGYMAIRPYIRHIHVKDGIRGADGKVTFCKVGEGQVGYQEHIRQLKRDGYDGLLSLETHYALEEGGKAAASEESLRALAAMVRGD
jgi:sugar phosphate isomerase/epimerase